MAWLAAGILLMYTQGIVMAEITHAGLGAGSQNVNSSLVLALAFFSSRREASLIVTEATEVIGRSVLD